MTNTPYVDDLVRFSIDNENEFNYNTDDSKWYKSAAVELISSPKYFTFDFNIIDDNPQIGSVKYGIGQPADMYFSIPQEAIQNTSVKFFIQTKNLKPDQSDPNNKWLEETIGGYYLNVPQGTDLQDRGKLKFITKRIASAETITISTVDDSQALFKTSFASFDNLPITGTLKLSDASSTHTLTNNSFVTLERKNGTRVGVFNIQSVDIDNVATYKLSIRSEYDFTMDETLIISYTDYSNTVPSVYQTTTTFNDLVNHEDNEQVPLITLVKQ